MSDWAQVDAWKATRRTEEAKREWRAFAYLVPSDAPEGYQRSSRTIRVRCRAGDARLKLERPCYYHPGKWRSLGFSQPRALGLDHRLRFLPESVLQALLVAHDAWQEEGAPRRSRPVELLFAPLSPTETPPRSTPASTPADANPAGETVP